MTLTRPPLAFLLFALLFAAIMGGALAVEPPPVRAANAPGQFDATAARARLARVLGDETPHPIDSDAQDVTRAALLAEIRALGLAPHVRETFACRANPNGPLIDCMMARNIVFSVGPADGPAVLAVTHYDSVPAAPGAADAGIGMAVWLEVARHLAREQEALSRRVIFLITDGEEPALMGAHVFASGDPLMQSVEALVNLEARGTRGPALFFETNQPNADAVAAFAGAPRGMANSVMADVYRMLPNNTDVTEFMRPGLDVVNIAISDGLEDYHTPQDSLANLDPRSLQHMGDIALHVTRTFASAPDRGAATPLVYTDIAGRAFVSAPNWAGQGALGLTVLIAFVAFWRAGAAGRWRSFATAPLALVLAGAATFAVGYAFGLARPAQDFWFAFPEAARAWCALLALTALAAALTLAPRNAAQAGAAGAFWFALVGLGLSFVAPGISILFALPALPYALGALIAFAWKPAQAIGAGVAAALALIIWTPTLALVEITLGYAMPYAFAILVVLLALTWLGAIVRAQGEARWRWTALTLAAASTAAIAIAAFLPSYSPTRPQPLNLIHFHDATANQARIVAGSARRALPPELAQAFAFAPQRMLPGDRQASWAAPVAAEPAPRPALEAVTLAQEGAQRIVRARLALNGAYRATLRLPRAANPISASMRGVETLFADTGGAGDYLNLACQGRFCDGAEIVLVFGEGAPLTEWFLIGQSPGALTQAGGAAIAARPSAATPIQFGDGVATLEPLPPAQN